MTNALDRREISHANMFYLDLSEAFDKLNHYRLINYLCSLGMNHGFLCWLCSYLCSRTMCVKIRDTLGPIITIPSGVPQGSVLGPFLFAAFMGDVIFSSNNIKCIKYADDVTLIEPLSSDQISSVSIHDCITIFEQKGLFLIKANVRNCIYVASCNVLQI